MTPDQVALLQKAQASLKAARLLADQTLYDFAASRAYYTMFYVAEAFLLEEGLAFSKHSAVIAAFGRQLTKTGRVPQEFHRYLLDGQDSRNAGDYDIRPGISESEAAKQITRAEQFLQLAERLIGPLPPTEPQGA